MKFKYEFDLDDLFWLYPLVWYVSHFSPKTWLYWVLMTISIAIFGILCRRRWKPKKDRTEAREIK
jgi:hypothetical protein